MPASSAGAITDMAVLLTGRVVVNLNYTAGREALRAAMGSAGIRNVITDRRFLAKLKDRGLDLSNVFDGVALHNIEDLKTGIGKAEGLLMLAAASVLPAGWAWRLLGHLAAPEDTAAILFSSGSEGTPKGIELTHRNLIAQDVREAFAIKFHKSIYEGYGTTETAPVASCNLLDHLHTHDWEVQLGHKPGTVDIPLPGTGFRIVDPVSLKTLPPGKDGLILISGPQVMKDYLNAPALTAEAIVALDGQRWYKTGDKGHLNQDGFLTIVDRYSRFAKVGGEMISLTQVEEQIRHVLAELELAALTVPDPKKGERIVLLIAADLDPDGLRRALIDAHMNPLTIPGEIRPVEQIPKLGSGKTDFSGAKKLALAGC